MRVITGLVIPGEIVDSTDRNRSTECRKVPNPEHVDIQDKKAWEALKWLYE